MKRGKGARERISEDRHKTKHTKTTTTTTEKLANNCQTIKQMNCRRVGGLGFGG